MSKLGSVADVLLRLIPLWIWIHIGLSTYVVWEVTYSRMIFHDRPVWTSPYYMRDRIACIAMLTTHFTLLGLFLLSAGTSWAHAWFHAPFYRPFGAQPPFRHRLLAIMACVFNPRACSASSRTGRMPTPPFPVSRWQQFDAKAAFTFFSKSDDDMTITPTQFRPNICARDPVHEACANGAAGRRDRMYHGHWFKLFTLGSCCLPVWDHYCPWVLTPVYLHTIKSYLLSIWYLLFYSANVTVILSFDASRNSPTLWRFTALPVSIISFLVFCWIGGYWGVHQVKQLGIKNITMYEDERLEDVWVVVMPTSDGKWILRRSSVNPWDQGGWYANLRHVMGEGWTWLVPFWQPRRVKEYDNQRLDYDEKYGPEFIKWCDDLQVDVTDNADDVRRPDDVRRRNRRAEASSSGIHGPIQPSRRRPQTDDQV